MITKFDNFDPTNEIFGFGKRTPKKFEGDDVANFIITKAEENKLDVSYKPAIYSYDRSKYEISINDDTYYFYKDGGDFYIEINKESFQISNENFNRVLKMYNTKEFLKKDEFTKKVCNSLKVNLSGNEKQTGNEIVRRLIEIIKEKNLIVSNSREFTIPYGTKLDNDQTSLPEYVFQFSQYPNKVKIKYGESKEYDISKKVYKEYVNLYEQQKSEKRSKIIDTTLDKYDPSRIDARKYNL